MVNQEKPLIFSNMKYFIHGKGKICLGETVQAKANGAHLQAPHSTPLCAKQVWDTPMIKIIHYNISDIPFIACGHIEI